MDIPTADELRRTRAASDKIKTAAYDRAQAMSALKAAATDGKLKASEQREYDQHQAEFEQLHALAAEREGDPEFRAKLGKVWTDGHRRPTDVGRKERLYASDKVLDWIKARERVDDYDIDQAWDAFARGLVFDDWTRWTNDFAPRGMSVGGEGGELVPSPLSGDVIDDLRASTPIFRAGATTVPMTSNTLDIARITGDPTATWHAESGAISASDVTLDRVTFTARTLPVMVKASLELSEDAPNLGAVVRRAIVGAVGVELTEAALRGDGASNNPTGIRNQTGVTVTELGAGNGADATWSDVANAARDVAENNAEPNAILWRPRTATALELTQDANNQFVPPPPTVAALDKFGTTAIPNNLTVGTSTNCAEVYVGDFMQLLIGMRTQLRVRMLTERFMDSGDIAFFAYLRADVQLEHGEAFTVLTGVTN